MPIASAEADLPQPSGAYRPLGDSGVDRSDSLFKNPQPLLAEYERRLTAATRVRSARPAPPWPRKSSGCARHRRLLDTYTDGYVEKADYEARIVHLKQR